MSGDGGGLLEKLEKILEFNFRNLLSKVNIFSGNTININFSRNADKLVEIKNGQELAIDLSRATDSQKRRIKSDVVDVLVQARDEAVLDKKSAQKTKHIKENLPDSADQNLLGFYRHKVYPDMYRAIEAALVIRNAFQKGSDVGEMKRDLARRYPEFGNNLCNLVTQGYFHDHFQELYVSMSEDPDFDLNNYRRKVSRIVRSLPFTVFAAKQKSLDELAGEVAFKLAKLRKYGAGELLIHGLGKENVSSVIEVLADYREDGGVSVQVDLNRARTVITAKLVF